MSGHLKPGRIRIGCRRFHHGRREPIWIGSGRHGFDSEPIWIELHQHVLEWGPIWIGSVNYGSEMDPKWIVLLRTSSIESLHGAGRSDAASDVVGLARYGVGRGGDMDRVGPLWIRHRSDMDWLDRHGFHCEQLWVAPARTDVLNDSEHENVQSHSTLEVHGFPLGIRPIASYYLRIP